MLGLGVPKGGLMTHTIGHHVRSLSLPTRILLEAFLMAGNRRPTRIISRFNTFLKIYPKQLYFLCDIYFFFASFPELLWLYM
jgi:hypothetical protein